MQDIDGNVPLHLLVRQAFYHYLGGIRERQRQRQCQRHINSNNNGYGINNSINNGNGTHPILTIIQELIISCPEASAVPDFTEYEETPLILVIKSSMAANEQQPQDDNGNANDTDDNDNGTDNNAPPGVDFNHTAELERQIFDVCKLILQSHPYAASFAASKSGYTAVHSADAAIQYDYSSMPMQPTANSYNYSINPCTIRLRIPCHESESIWGDSAAFCDHAGGGLYEDD